MQCLISQARAVEINRLLKSESVISNCEAGDRLWVHFDIMLNSIAHVTGGSIDDDQRDGISAGRIIEMRRRILCRRLIVSETPTVLRCAASEIIKLYGSTCANICRSEIDKGIGL